MGAEAPNRVDIIHIARKAVLLQNEFPLPQFLSYLEANIPPRFRLRILPTNSLGDITPDMASHSPYFLFTDGKIVGADEKRVSVEGEPTYFAWFARGTDTQMDHTVVLQTTLSKEQVASLLKKLQIPVDYVQTTSK